MRIAVVADDDQWKEINAGIINVDYCRINGWENISTDVNACLILQLDMKNDLPTTNKPILMNAVCTTLKEMKAPENVVRINGWNSFLGRSTWEVAGNVSDSIQAAFSAMSKQIIQVPDEPGFISARVIAMIINEAYFALEDKISTKHEIDIAMKLGTNYPHGPFEWATIIGIDKIFALLQKLSTSDKRYLPSTLLKQEASTWV
ncbi:MAG: 3-hydroxyacyl-CoA dehydrogenase family protein [Ferruginibacter sp.]